VVSVPDDGHVLCLQMVYVMYTAQPCLDVQGCHSDHPGHHLSS
jgi:hypothetical protein